MPPITSDAVPAAENVPLILIDELRKRRLSSRQRLFIKALLGNNKGPIIAKAYLKTSLPDQIDGYDLLTYGFESEGYEDKVGLFVKGIVERYHPKWAIALGFDNEHLISRLCRLNVPVIVCLDQHIPWNDPEKRPSNIFLGASHVVFFKREYLGTAFEDHWVLKARTYPIVFDPASSRLGRKAGVSGFLISLFQTAWQIANKKEEAGKSVELLQSLGRGLAKPKAQSLVDQSTIMSSGMFNARLYLGALRQDESDSEAVAMYLHASRIVIPRDRPFAGRILRRPLEGFNPLIYASDNKEFDEDAGEDPLAHYIRSGAPRGRWAHRVIKPSDDAGVTRPGTAALHAHFHYTDLLDPFLDRLGQNHPVDLFITTTSDERRQEILETLGRRNIKAEAVLARPNRGRDIGPFIDLYRSGTFSEYDVVGHVHGKKSPHYDKGALWHDFLSDHLIGGAYPIADRILEAFAADETLGLVFAEDPHLGGWDENMRLASQLAAQMELDLPFPNHFDYPIGTMFWARRQALQPLMKLQLDYSDYPEEPLAIDGTILHALERIITFCVVSTGYEYAVTYIPESVR